MENHIVDRLTEMLILLKKYGNKDDAVRLPGGFTIPAIALLKYMGYLLSTKIRNLVAGAIALWVGGVIYFFRNKEK